MRPAFRDIQYMSMDDGNGMGTEEFERIATIKASILTIRRLSSFEIRRGARYMGCREFVIPREVYQDGFLLSSTR